MTPIIMQRVVDGRERDRREASPKGPPVATSTLEQPSDQHSIEFPVERVPACFYVRIASCLLGVGEREEPAGCISILDTGRVTSV